MAERYLNKGNQVGVTGYIQTGSYEKSDGTKVYTTDIVATNITLVASENTGNRPYSERNERSRGNGQEQEKNGSNGKISDKWEELDEDIPF